VRRTPVVPGYGEERVPRGTSRRWEVVLSDDERPADGERIRASAVRSEHKILAPFSDNDLAQIPILGTGERLARYKVYLDLHDPARADFLAEGVEVVGPGQRIVPKADVPGDLWVRLVDSAHEVIGWRRRRTA
jgi:hypothetical protein